jgi:hypothetical protein
MLEIGWAAAGLRGAATVEDTLCHGRGSRRRLPGCASGFVSGNRACRPDDRALYWKAGVGRLCRTAQRDQRAVSDRGTLGVLNIRYTIRVCRLSH